MYHTDSVGIQSCSGFLEASFGKLGLPPWFHIWRSVIVQLLLFHLSCLYSRKFHRTMGLSWGVSPLGRLWSLWLPFYFILDSHLDEKLVILITVTPLSSSEYIIQDSRIALVATVGELESSLEINYLWSPSPLATVMPLIVTSHFSWETCETPKQSSSTL